MNVLLSWLREVLPLEVNDTEVASRLTMLGLESTVVSSALIWAETLIIGRINRVSHITDGENLKDCDVDIGKNRVLRVVCGAPNVKEGMGVVFAECGVRMPDGKLVESKRFGRVTSEGMFCSIAEIGLGKDESKLYEASGEPGQRLIDYLGLNEPFLEVDVTPNRADCMSIFGLARELSGVYSLPKPTLSYCAEVKISETMPTEIREPLACPMYLSRVIRGMDMSQKTPDWIAKRLLQSGQRLHSLIVDVTNYVMLELGQPMHAFDLAKIEGGIVVRYAEPGEATTLLNGKTVDLTTDTLVIADRKKNLGIAGVMGGLSSSVVEQTKDILLESAFFNPGVVAGKSNQYSLTSEAALRFERGVDPKTTRLALERASEILIATAGGELSLISENLQTNSLRVLAPIKLLFEEVEAVLGFCPRKDWIKQQLEQFDFNVVKFNGGLEVTAAHYRFDINNPADLIEELARLHGYDKLPVFPLIVSRNVMNVENTQTQVSSLDKVAQRMVGWGYYEIISYSFISRFYDENWWRESQSICIDNPISSDKSVMRRSLWPGLLESAKLNQRRGILSFRLFERGVCFEGIEPDRQILKFAALVSGPRDASQWLTKSRMHDFFDLKGDFEALAKSIGKSCQFNPTSHSLLHPYQSALISFEGREIGCIGVLHPAHADAMDLVENEYILLEVQASFFACNIHHSYVKLNNYQSVSRDLALVVKKEVSAGSILDAIAELSQPDLIDYHLFDVYQGKGVKSGYKSMTFSFLYRSDKKTLTDTEVEQKVNELIEFLGIKCSAELRT